MENTFAVILAGGSGTRFWPLSREKKPKQFLALTSERSLIAETAARVDSLCGAAKTLVVCGKAHEKNVRVHLPDLPPENVLVEPAARNTAAAIGLAALEIRKRNPEGVMLILPSDHHVGEPAKQQAALMQAVLLARAGWLVTLGIAPTRAETGFGYIRCGESLEEGAFRVAQFVEKPDRATAAKYLADGRYSWNAGIFAFRADRLLEELPRHAPALHAGLMRIEANPRLAGRIFSDLPSISIDYAVMEKAERIAVIPSSFGWSDVGSFAALPEVRTLDSHGNAVVGDALCIDSDGCVVLAQNRLVAVVGMKDVVVVDTGDAVLVVPREKAQDVRKVVEALKARGSKLL